jgi:hypothetical protein
VQRLCFVSLPMLLLLVACTHERSAARPSAAQAASTPATASTPAPSPAAAPVAAPPANAPASSPAPDAAAAPAPSKAGSAVAARSSRPPPKTSPTETTSAAAAAIHPPSPPAAAARAPTAAGATPALDLTALEQRLRDTHAIGLFTKLSLKNQVDDLLAQFKAFHSGGSRVSLTELRQKFELLLVKVVTLLQDNDPSLAAAVSSSREALWGVLSDPKKFANI